MHRDRPTHRRITVPRRTSPAEAASIRPSAGLHPAETEGMARGVGVHLEAVVGIGVFGRLQDCGPERSDLLVGGREVIHPQIEVDLLRFASRPSRPRVVRCEWTPMRGSPDPHVAVSIPLGSRAPRSPPLGGGSKATVRRAGAVEPSGTKIGVWSSTLLPPGMQRVRSNPATKRGHRRSSHASAWTSTIRSPPRLTPDDTCAGALSITACLKRRACSRVSNTMKVTV